MSELVTTEPPQITFTEIITTEILETPYTDKPEFKKIKTTESTSKTNKMPIKSPMPNNETEEVILMSKIIFSKPQLKKLRKKFLRKRL